MGKLEDLVNEWELEKVKFICDFNVAPKVLSLYLEHEKEIWDILWELKGDRSSILTFLALRDDADNAQDADSFYELITKIAIGWLCKQRLSKIEDQNL